MPKEFVTISSLSPELLTPICPRTKKPIKDMGSYWLAPGFPNLRIWKESFGTTFSAMTAELVLSGQDWNGRGNGKGPLFDLTTKDGRPYEAFLVPNAEETKLEMVFPTKREWTHPPIRKNSKPAKFFQRRAKAAAYA